MSQTKSRKLTQEKRIVAANRMEMRSKTHETVKSISDSLHISRKHLYDLEDKHKDHPDMQDLDRSGRPKKVSLEMERCIVRAVKKEPFTSAIKLVKTVNEGLEPKFQIKPRTFIHYALKNHLKCFRPARKPHLTKSQISSRLEFAKKYMNHDMRFWSRVVFTDEAYVLLHPTDCRERVRRPQHQRFKAPYMVGTMKNYRGGQMFWGSINYHGTGTLVSINGHITGETYLMILRGQIPLIKEKLKLTSFTLLDDNAPPHRAEIVKVYKEAEGIQGFEQWPPNSPDINPIEDIWRLLKDRIRKRMPKTLKEIEVVAADEWSKITIDEIRSLIESLPRRLEAIIRSRGCSTKY